MTKVTAILSGGDWADAGVEHLVLPDEVEIDREKELYDTWYARTYCSALCLGRRPKFKTFTEWLVEKGARYTTEEELVEYQDI